MAVGAPRRREWQRVVACLRRKPVGPCQKSYILCWQPGGLAPQADDRGCTATAARRPYGGCIVSFPHC
jgi:hypothetical protein